MQIIRLLSLSLLCLTLMAQAQPVRQSAAESLQLVRLESADMRAQAQVIERYENFKIALMPQASFEALQQGTREIANLGDYALALSGDANAQDPQQRQPWSSTQRRDFPAGELYLVQFHGPSKAQWLDALRTEGVEPIQYLHPFSYLVWNRSGALERISQQIPALRWAGDYPLSARYAVNRNPSNRTWRVVAYRGAALNSELLRAVGANRIEYSRIDPTLEHWVLDADSARVPELAALPGVLSVQDLPSDGGDRGEIAVQQFAGNVVNNVPEFGFLNWLAGFGLNGTGVRMANVDGGVDQTHPDLINRMLSCTGGTCSATSSSHGTHTAGAMVADASSGVRDARGYLRGLGVAPGAQIVEQVYAGFFNQAGGMLRLMRESAQNGAVLSSNSWGPAATARGYDAQTREVDVGVRDTDPNLAGDQPLIYVVSMMNGNGGVSSQGTPDEAKNLINVGSTNSQNTSGPLPSWQSISANSGHGPALDGRTIPHLVTPGCSTDSTQPNNSYGLACGTSMASPLVSGAIAVFLEGFARQYPTRAASAELVKAYLVSATEDLFGGTDADGVPLTRRPNPKQGFGALRLGTLLQQLQQSVFADREVTFVQSGQGQTLRFYVLDPLKPVKLVLSYTDAPGAGTCSSSTCTTPAWVNDLDLIVIHNGQRYLGNVFGSNGFSVTGGSAEQRNNLELVALPAGSDGLVEVEVMARNIAGDALPNVAGALQQDFALLCSNCRAGPRFNVSEDTGSLWGMCTSLNANIVPQTFNVIALPGFSGTLQASLAQPAGFNLSASPANLVPPVIVNITGTVANTAQEGSQQVSFTVSQGNESLQRTMHFLIAHQALPAPNLPPLSGLQNLRPLLSWQAQPAAISYRLDLSRSADFATLYSTRINALVGQWTPSTNLSAGTRYYWRLQANNACGDGALSTIQSFVTAPGTDQVLMAQGFEDY